MNLSASIKKHDRLFNLIIAVVSIIGTLILQPVFDNIFDYSVTPSKLITLLKDGKIAEFNKNRNEIVDRIEFVRLDLSGKELQGVDLRSVRITDSNFTNSNLSNSNMDEASFFRTTFNNADLTNSTLKQAKLEKDEYTVVLISWLQSCMTSLYILFLESHFILVLARRESIVARCFLKITIPEFNILSNL